MEESISEFARSQLAYVHNFMDKTSRQNPLSKNDKIENGTLMPDNSG